MAEETASATPTAAAETSPVVAETTSTPEESPQAKPTDAPQEEEAATKETAVNAAETAEIDPSGADHKRKLEDLEGEGEKKDDADLGDEKNAETEAKKIDEADDGVDAKRQRVADGLGAGEGEEAEKTEAPPVGNGQLPYTENIVSGGSVETVQNSMEGVSQQGIFPSAGQQEETSRSIEVPNNKVGVLIGRSGETIRQLQNSSGARIQISRDSEANLNSSTRPVEVTGTPENINKAEQLIKDVIAEADAGGSPALVARGFGAAQSGSEVFEMQVPNERVGTIIGKGGENIKALQTKSQARIQLIPQHLPEGDFSEERTVRITGYKRQIEAAKSMIKDVLNQPPGRSSNLSSGHNQGYRSRGPPGPSTGSQWGPRAPPPMHSQTQQRPNTSYNNYPQRGTYQSQPQTTQYPQQSYGPGNNYPQQPPPRSWEQQRPAAAAPAQNPGGYDYYNQGQSMGGMGMQPSNPVPAPTSAPINYNNYGQPQAAGYGQPQAAGYGPPQTAGYGQSNPYPQSGPPQTAGYGYNEPPKNENQAPMYGQQGAQQGLYPQQGSTTPGYTQQQTPYTKPAPAYNTGPPNQAPIYNQGPMPLPYGSGGPPPAQQPYPGPGPTYGQGYGGPTPGVADGYNQPPPATGYSQPPAGYGQYPSAQPAYGSEQSAPSNVNYGYQGGPADAGYGNSVPPSSGYGVAPPAVGAQQGYAQPGGYMQPPANQAAAYDQSMMAPQPGYGSVPAPYTKGASPQPGAYGGGGQYDSVPMYGHQS